MHRAERQTCPLKMLRRKRFRKPQKIISPQTYAQVCILKSIILVDSLLEPHYVTVRNPIFKIDYARYQIRKTKKLLISF